MSHASPLVSAIVVTHNNNVWLRKSLPSLLGQSWKSLEVIVVDNASEDGTAELVQSAFPLVRLVKRSVNDGFGAGNNAGMQVATGKYVFIGNDDLVLDRAYFKELVRVMEQDPTIGACQGTMYDYQVQSPKSKVQSIHYKIRDSRQSGVQSVGKMFNPSGILVGEERRAPARSRSPAEIFYANAPLLRRAVLDRVGGFDEDYFLYFEETDLCWRIWLAGSRVVWVPQARMYHAGGVTASVKPSGFILEQSLRNRINSYIKNAGWRTLFVSLVVQLLVSFGGIIVFLTRGRFSLVSAVIKAWIWNLWHLQKTIAKRRKIQGMRVIGDRELFSRVGNGLPVSRLLAGVRLRRGL